MGRSELDDLDFIMVRSPVTAPNGAQKKTTMHRKSDEIEMLWIIGSLSVLSFVKFGSAGIY